MESATGAARNWSEGAAVHAGDRFLGLYEPSPETDGYWRGVQREELLLKYCEKCPQFLHPRRIGCPDCRNLALTWRRAEGTAEIYSYSNVHRAPTVDLQGSTPYTVGLVRLSEGVHLFSRLYASDAWAPFDDTDYIGKQAFVAFKALEDGEVLPVFVVTESNEGRQREA